MAIRSISPDENIVLDPLPMQRQPSISDGMPQQHSTNFREISPEEGIVLDQEKLPSSGLIGKVGDVISDLSLNAGSGAVDLGNSAINLGVLYGQVDPTQAADWIDSSNQVKTNIESGISPYAQQQMENIANAEGFIGTTKEVFKNPYGTLNLTARNLSNSLPSMATAGAGAAGGAAIGTAIAPGIGTIIGGGIGAVGGGFVGEAPIEIGSWVEQALQERGADLSTKEGRISAYSNKALMDDIRGEAERKGLTTAAVDSVWNLFAGSKLAKTVGKPLPTRIIAGAKDTGVQMVGGMASEAAGQTAAYNGDLSKVSGSDIALEGLLEVPSSVGEVAIGSMIRNKAQQEGLSGRGNHPPSDNGAPTQPTEPPAPSAPPVPNRDDLARMINSDATAKDSSVVQPETVKPPISGTPEIGDTIEHVDQYGQVIEGTIDSIQEGENGQKTLIVTDAQGNQNIVFDGEGETIIRDKRPLNRDDLLSEIQRGQPKQDVALQDETQPLIEPDIAPQDTPIAVQKQPKTDTIESVQSRIDNIRAQAKMSGWNGMLKRREQEALNQLSALKQTEINQSALEANPEPTEAQKQAGNYKKGHVKVSGFDITIENAKGSVRKGIDSDGEAWETTMPANYGYIKRTEGADGDNVDVYIGDNPDAQEVFIVDQIDPVTGKFDEHKVMMGFNSSKEAGDAYKNAFSDGKGVSRVGAVEGMSIEKFKEWLKTSDTKKPMVYQEPAPKPAKTQEVKPKSVEPKPNTVSTPIKGEVGMMLSSGQVATTASGRTTTPFPKFSTETPRKTSLAVKNVENWLMQNALAEANARGDEFNALQFQANMKKPSQADKDSAEYYLFGETQPQVQKSIFREPKPVVNSELETTTNEPVSAENAPTAQTAPKSQKPDKNNVQRLADVDKETAEKFANTVLEQAKGLEDEIRAYFKNANQDAPEKIKTIDRAISELLRNDKLGDNFKEQLRQIQYQAAPPVIPSEPVQESKPDQEVIYNGIRIYPLPVKSREEGSPPVQMWAVESAQNKARRESGERAGMGDTLHSTLDEAKKQADFDVLQQKDAAKRDALNSAKKKEEEDKTAAIKADTYNGFLDGKPENTKALIRKALSKQYNFTDGGGVMTVRERIEGFNDNGTLKTSTIEEDKIKPMSKMQYHRADNKQQEAHDARVKEAGKKTTYLVNESDVGKIGYDYAEHLLAQKSKQDQETAPKPDVAEAPAEPKKDTIEDFGEKISGAKKDLWKDYEKAISAELPEDLKDITLSKHFPEPNYEAMIANGVTTDVLAAIKAMRDIIPNKPKMTWKLKQWAKKVTIVRELANKIIEEKYLISEIKGRMSTYSSALDGLVERMELYTELGYPAFTKAKGWDVNRSEGVYENGKPLKGTFYFASFENGYGNRFDTREQAVDFIRAKLSIEETSKGKKPTKFEVFRITKTGEIVIGKKIAAGKFINLKGGFKTGNEARLYMAENGDELIALYEKKKDVPPERRSINDPRKGEDYRNGEDVSVETLAKTFGFRGIQFGNYVEQKRRTADINNAYDAMKDMATILGLPENALSLEGTLGLAFGARGGGSFAAAHYERGQTVINLTKSSGAGSLAHEWFHAFDHHFGKRRDGKDVYITDSAYIPTKEIRKEVTDAFADIVRAIKKTGILKRSESIDKTRSKDYWSTDIEMAARSFEAYIIYKAEQKSGSNDYLANVVGKQAWDVSRGENEDDSSYPYPTDKEMSETIAPAFDKLFEVLDTKDTDKGAVMFSLTSGQKPTVTSTQAFKDWFSSSKVVDDNGNPLVVYHGSPLSFDKFKEGSGIYGSGIYFSKDKKTAQSYSDNGVIYETYLSIQKPFIIDDLDSLESEYENDGEVDTTALIENLKSSGFDGIIINDKNSETYAVAFDPEQIKSVNNRGTFDGNDPRISFSRTKDESKSQNKALVDKIVADLNAQAKKLGLPENSAVIFENLSNVKNVPNLEKASQDGGVVDGFYYKNLIYIAMTAKDYISTLNHEAVHYLKAAGAFTPAEWSALLEKAPKWREKYNIQKNYGDLNLTESKLDEEAIAHALQDYSNQGILTRIRNKIVKYFNMVKNVLTGKGLGYKSAQDIFDDIMSGEIGRRRFDPEYDVEPMFSRSKTDSFKKWFGDSKIIDKSGNPMIVYHGTGSDFEKFDDTDKTAKGFYFTRSQGLASDYAMSRSSDNDGNGAKVIPVYLSIKNPKIIKDKVLFESIKSLFQTKKQARKERYRRVTSSHYLMKSEIDAIKSQGYDGIVNEAQSEIVAFEPSQIKSVNNRGTFDANDERIMFSRKVMADGLQSTLVKSVQNLKQAKGTGQQMLGILKNTDGVKEEEIAWTGLDDFLLSKPTVSKQEIVDYLDQNQVKIDEVTLDGQGWKMEVDEDTDGLDRYVVYKPDGKEYGRYEKSTTAQSVISSKQQTKFSQYTLAGGENYREMLLTLPNKDSGKDKWRVVDKNNNPISKPMSMEEASKIASENQGSALEPIVEQTDSYKSSHFDQPNILAHVRLNDRTDSDGKKVLFVEEIQSDWAQTGRKKGFKGQGNPYPDDYIEPYRQEMKEKPKFADKDLSDQEVIDYFGLKPKDSDYVPSMPMSKSWHEMAFRRIVQMAAQQGYDSVAWTTGEMQNNRYDLSKSVSAVNYSPETKKLIAFQEYNGDKLGKVLIDKNDINENDIEDYVGKDVAKRLLETQKDRNGIHWLTGDGLKVGGDGMKGFYDNILVKYANKFGKKFDAKVGEAILDGIVERGGQEATGKRFQDGLDVKVHSMDITPSMRDAADEGLPMFSMKKDDKSMFCMFGNIIGKKLNKKEQLEAVIEALDLHNSEKELRPELGRIASYVLHPRQIASLYEKFTPVFTEVTKMMQRRDKIVHDLSVELNTYNHLDKTQKDRVNAVLEIGRLSKETFKVKDGKLTVKNENHPDAIYSKKGDSITLNDLETRAYLGVRKGMDDALDIYIESILEEYGFLEMGIKNSGDLINALKKEKNKVVINQMQNALKMIKDIESAKRMGYIPLKRWGEIGITVRTKDGESPELVHFERVELGKFRKKKILENKDVLDVITKLREQYGEDYVIDYFEVKDFAKLRAKVDLSELDILAASSDMTSEDYDEVRKALADVMKGQGFRSHFFKSNDVSGYSDDFERALNDYAVSIAGHLARKMHQKPIEAKQKAIVDAGQTSLAEYAEKYVSYVTDPVEEFRALRQINFVWYLAGNIASGITNATQPFMVTAPWFKAMFSHGQIMKAMSKAYKDAAVMTSIKSGLDVFNFDKAPDDIRDVLKQADEDGLFIPLQTHDAMAIAYSNATTNRAFNRRLRTAQDVLALSFTIPERTNRVVTYMSAYRFAIDQNNKSAIMKFVGSDQLARQELAGKTGKEFAMAFAEYAVYSTQLQMGRLNRPSLGRGIGTLPTQFMSYSLQMMELMYRLSKVHGGKSGTALAMMLFAVVAMSGLKGFPFEDDVQEMIEAGYKRLTRTDLDIDTEVKKILTKAVGETMAQSIMYGIPAGFLNVDMSSRLGYGNIVPDDNSDLLGVWWDMLYTRPTTAMTSLARGDVMQAFADVAPAIIKNPLQSYIWSQEGVKSARTGDTIIPKEDLTTSDIALKAFGFTSGSISKERQRIFAQKRANTAVNDLRSDYYDKLARAYAGRRGASDSGTKDDYEREIQGIYQDIENYNSDAEMYRRIIINPSALKRRVVEEVKGASVNKSRKQARGNAQEIDKAFGKTK